jgi:hypothetical protein
MPHYFGQVTYDPENTDFKAMFEQCRVKAEPLGYTYFGIQNMRECWGSKNAQETYDKHGCDDRCTAGNDAKYGAGEQWGNFVYRVKKGMIYT